MKKFIVLFAAIVFTTTVFSGCGKAEVVKTKIFENEVYVEYEITCSYDGKDIYGIACVPVDVDGEMPTVIFSHGFRGNVKNTEDYAQSLAGKGVASYRFEFYGGSTESKSGGEMTEMSIFTEKSDLEAVLDMVQNLDFVDKDNLYLFGESQGGTVSAIIANEHKNDIKGLILLYPAFVIPDDAREMFDSVEDIPEIVNFMGVDLGKIYYEDLLDYDIYENIDNYKEDVLIFHGDKDAVVDISYAEKALEVYDSAELVVIEGAGHGNFSAEMKQKVVDMTYEYIMK